ncbi:glycosyltransferase [Arthrobacter sp. G119Y2]|uniref:glycosyltransferase n=1 Tax=Arthrobacter sp. G119Y2 TaxID=3134965 RepID=UPI00311953C2
MKVAVLLNRLSGGGAERVGTTWAEGLRSHGHSVDVVVTHEPPSVDVQDCVRLEAGSFGRRIWKLRTLIRSQKYDVVVSLMPHWNVLSLLAVLASGKKVKTVISLHSLEAGMVKTHGLSFVAETLLARFLYRAADAVIAVSHAVGAEAKSKYNIERQKLWVVPNPVLDSLSGVGSARRSTKDSLALIYAGRLVGQKKPETLLYCAATLMNESNIPTVRVEFFGAGPLEKSLRLEAERLGVPTIFHGWRADWSASCPSDGVLVLPSMVEGFGNVLVEAAAIGLPSVSSSRALGVADAILPGVTGALAAGDHTADYCDAIRQAIAVPPFTVSPWLERFTAEHAASIVNRIIGELGLKRTKADV